MIESDVLPEEKQVLLVSGAEHPGLAMALRGRGVHLTQVQSHEGAVAAIAEHHYATLIAPLSRFLASSFREFPGHRVAWVSVEEVAKACSALGDSIDDCLVLPLVAEEVLLSGHRPKPPRMAATPLPQDVIIGQDAGLANAWKIARKAAGFDADVLITGESGTGKELFARAIHRMSDCSGGPFVAVNCAAVPRGLLESQLFGHVKGAFTDAHQDKQGVFRKADGGTLFLDEVGDFPLDLQAKVLRALQTREVHPVGSEVSVKVNIRLVSATSRDLEKLCASKLFRDDLYYRLAVVPIALPPLRDRRQDLPALIDHFLERFASKHVVEATMSSKGRGLLIEADWPGNVRQLQNVVERLVVLSEAGQVSEDSIAQEMRPASAAPQREQSPSAHSTFSLQGRSLKEAMHTIEAHFVAEALRECGDKRAASAKLLSISQRALLYKIKEHDL